GPVAWSLAPAPSEPAPQRLDHQRRQGAGFVAARVEPALAVPQQQCAWPGGRESFGDVAVAGAITRTGSVCRGGDGRGGEGGVQVVPLSALAGSVEQRGADRRRGEHVVPGGVAAA